MDLEEKYLNEALNLLDNSNDKSGIARALLGLEHLYRYTGRWDAAAESSLRASSIASEIDDKWIKARALYGLGRYFTFVGKFRRAEQSFRESIDLFTRLDFLQRVADARGQLSVVLSQTNRDQEAVLEVEQSLKIHEELKALRDVGYDYLTLALIWLHAKDYEKAEEFAHKSLDVSQQTKYAHGIAVSQMILGDVMVNIGESDEATQWLIQAEEGFEQTKNIYSQVDVTLKLADLRHVTGNSKERDNLLGLSEKLLTKWMPDLQARYHFIKGKVEIESGNRPRGFKWLSDALKFSLLYNCFYLDRLADEIFDYLKLFAPDAVVACGQFLIQYWQNELYDDTSLINIEAKDRVEQMPIPLPTFTFIEKITKFLTDTGIDESILEPK
jgi:tetratricopeptide (TPR) repeat protein